MRHRYILLCRLGIPEQGDDTFETVCADSMNECLRMIADDDFHCEYIAIIDGETMEVLRSPDLESEVAVFIRSRWADKRHEHSLERTGT